MWIVGDGKVSLWKENLKGVFEEVSVSVHLSTALRSVSLTLCTPGTDVVSYVYQYVCWENACE